MERTISGTVRRICRFQVERALSILQPNDQIAPDV
jgi:hypothetical protein